MEMAEYKLYANFTYLFVDNFEILVDNIIDKREISDTALLEKLLRIGGKLQTISSEYKTSSNGSEMKNGFIPVKMELTDNEEKSESDKKDEWHEFFEIQSSKIENNCIYDNVRGCPLVEVSSTTIKLDKSMNNEYTLSRKDQEIVRKFQLENVKLEYIRGEGGLFIEEFTRGAWRCLVCKLENLSDSNILSHVNGKSHLRKIEAGKQDSSTTKLDFTFTSDLSSAFPDVQQALLRKENGTDIIVPFQGYHCNVCSSTINSKESLKLHLSGGKHRKNCESL